MSWKRERLANVPQEKPKEAQARLDAIFQALASGKPITAEEIDRQLPPPFTIPQSMSCLEIRPTRRRIRGCSFNVYQLEKGIVIGERVLLRILYGEDETLLDLQEREPKQLKPLVQQPIDELGRYQIQTPCGISFAIRGSIKESKHNLLPMHILIVEARHPIRLFGQPPLKNGQAVIGVPSDPSN